MRVVHRLNSSAICPSLLLYSEIEHWIFGARSELSCARLVEIVNIGREFKIHLHINALHLIHLYDK